MHSQLAGFHNRAVLWIVCAVLGVLTLPVYRIASLVAVLEEKGGQQCLPEYDQKRKHDDYLPGFKWIPRSATVFCDTPPPRVLIGNLHEWHVRYDTDLQKGPPRVPAPGEGYFATTSILTKDGSTHNCHIISYTTSNWLHIRAGECGWDDTDGFYSVPSVAAKKITLNYEALLFHWENPAEKDFLR